MNKNWKSMFASRIYYRGVDLYESGRVGEVYKTDTGFEAIVYGTKKYTVTIDVKHDRVVDMDCTCPYAEDGSYCKHEAAVLMKLSYEDISDEPSETIEDIIDQMPEEKLREELIKLAKENSEFHRYLFNKYRTKPVDSSYPDAVFRELSMLEDIYGDRSGFIDWRSGHDYVHAFENCLEDMIQPMIDNGEYMIAFESLKKAFDVLNHVEMDGSDGEHSIIAGAIQLYWDPVIFQADEAEKEQMYHWFEKMEADCEHLICGDIIPAILDTSFEGRKYLLPRLEKTRLDLEAMCEYPNRLRELLPKYKSLLRRCDEDLCEYDDWLNRHSDLEVVKEIRLHEAMEKEDYDAVIGILEDLIETNSTSWNVSRWKKQLLDLYRETGRRDKTKDMLIEQIFQSYSVNLDEIWELKTYCAQSEWEELREQILLKYPDICADIYYEEKMYDKLLKSLSTASDEKLNHYKNVLRDEYPDKLLQIYLSRIDVISAQRAGTSLYRRIESLFLNAADIAGSKAELIVLIHNLEQWYPTRRGMLKMLDSVRENLRKK